MATTEEAVLGSATGRGPFGSSIKRREDPRLITGRGLYTDDVRLVGMLHMEILRSPYAHAKITRLDVSKAKAHPGVNLNTNHIFTFEALQVAADATKRAGSTDPKAVADAIRKTNITDNVSIGPGIQFDEKGQNDKLKNAAIQNRGGKLVTPLPDRVAAV